MRMNLIWYEKGEMCGFITRRYLVVSLPHVTPPPPFLFKNRNRPNTVTTLLPFPPV